MNQPQAPLRVYIEEDDGQLVAQCVDIDIIGFGSTPDEAIQSFIRAYIRMCLVAHQADKAVDDLPPPSADLVAKWDRATSEHKQVMHFSIPNFALRPHRGDETTCDPRNVQAVLAAAG